MNEQNVSSGCLVKPELRNLLLEESDLAGCFRQRHKGGVLRKRPPGRSPG